MDLVLATRNQGKVEEMRPMLASVGFSLINQTDTDIPSAVEDGATFVENALIKARHACTATGCAALADDSGLVVPVLGGDPGLRSARYSGEGDLGNNALLLENMTQYSGGQRAGFYIAVVVFLRHADDPTPIIAEGRWYGRIAEAPRGKGGFGYDPIFIPEGSQRHAAELAVEEKSRVSHRAKAVHSLIKQLQI
ncbi:MAG: RdgB/HAM1 family non-canonical purine NTP pyrophosphatase [Pseudomonadota bacterium]|nr:RdgB/HAM1 family non-canonical purine NTP pyrophosphatase [Pseudomonadota bacterium]